jgi:hypothetical protein
MRDGKHPALHVMEDTLERVRRVKGTIGDRQAKSRLPSRWGHAAALPNGLRGDRFYRCIGYFKRLFSLLIQIASD